MACQETNQDFREYETSNFLAEIFGVRIFKSYTCTSDIRNGRHKKESWMDGLFLQGGKHRNTLSQKKKKGKENSQTLGILMP